MARNKIADLNNHLFMQLERLNDETTKPEEMELEIKKAEAVSKIAAQIINSNKLVLDAAKLIGKGFAEDLPEQFGLKQIGG